MNNKEIEKQSLFEMYSKTFPLDYDEMKEKVIYYYNKINEIDGNNVISNDINDLDISIRSLNVLKTSKINNVSELLVYSESDLFKFRNLGKKSIYEIVDALKMKGLILKK